MHAFGRGTVRLAMNRLARQAMVFLFDLSALAIVALVFDVLPLGPVREVAHAFIAFPRSLLLVFLLWLVDYICDFYSSNAFRIDSRLLRVFAINTVLDATVFLLFVWEAPGEGIPWGAFLLWMALYSGAFVALRLAARQIHRRPVFTVPVCFLVDHPAVGEIIDEFTFYPQAGYVPAFVLSSNGGESARGKAKVLRDDAEALEEIRKGRNPIVVFNGDEKRNALYASLLEDNSQGVRFCSLSGFYEFALEKVPLNVITGGWLLENVRSRNRRGFHAFKRALDLSLSVVMLVASLPLWPLIGIAIKLESPGPVLFRQERLGKDRRRFTILKFRTMRVSGNDHAPTEKKDSRVTALGVFLRRTRLDEIPQAVNILKGEMSFIGPRPERPELAEMLAREIPFYYERNRVLPGITGWDQVCGEYHSPSSSDTYKKIQYDLYYIKNRSVGLELRILLKTIRTMLLREGR